MHDNNNNLTMFFGWARMQLTFFIHFKVMMREKGLKLAFCAVKAVAAEALSLFLALIRK